MAIKNVCSIKKFQNDKALIIPTLISVNIKNVDQANFSWIINKALLNYKL